MTDDTTAPPEPPDDHDADGTEDPLAGLDFELTADERSRREMGKACRLVHSACSKWLKGRGIEPLVFQSRRNREGRTGEPRDTIGHGRARGGQKL